MKRIRSKLSWTHTNLLVLTLLTFPVLAGIIGGSAAFANSKSRVLEWEGSAAPLAKVIVRAGNGSISVKAVESDRVRIRVEISAKRWTDDEPKRKFMSWFLTSGDLTDEELIDSIRLQADEEDGTVEFGLRPSGRTRKSRVNEKWTIEMPARLALDSKMDAAEVDVAGLEGGVFLRLGNGSANLDLAGGDLDVKVTVGQLKVRTQGDYGNIKLRSTVGDTEMWLRGLRIEYPNPPGPGSRLDVDGKGTYNARVEVEVGDAELHVD